MLSHIRRVDIEFHSYCNRLCEWCPNKTLRRDFDDIEMQDELYTKILKELVDNNFGNSINITSNSYTNPLDRAKSESLFSFLGYQEPFTNPELFKKRVKEAYDKLPNTVQITASTNGDFLQKKYLEELYLTTLLISDYDNKGMDFWRNKLSELDILVVSEDTINEILIGIHRYIGNIKVQCNWTKHHQLENRGGYFSKKDLSKYILRNDMQERKYKCHEMSYNLTINHKGIIMPCCHMRDDNDLHKEFILGDLNKNTILEIINTDKFIKLKSDLLSSNFKEQCKHCQKTRLENLIYNE